MKQEMKYNAAYDPQFFAEVYDNHPQAIVWMPPIHRQGDGAIVDFAYVYANEEGLRYLNLEREQLDGLTLENSPTLTNELRSSILAEMVNVLQEGHKSETTVYNAALGKWARVLRTRLRGGVLTIVQDITRERNIIRQLEQQKALLEEQAVRLGEQKALLDNILHHSSNGISVSRVLRNDSGEVVDALTVMANDAAVKYSGLPRELYLSKKATELDPGIIGSPYYKSCVQTLESGEPFVMQYHLEPVKRWLELTVSRLDADHLIHIFTDVTPIKEAQLQLERTVQELQRSNMHLQEFAYAASHDLKEPLRKIRTFGERLKASLSDRLTEDEGGLFGRIESAADRMQQLVDDLLEFSHVSNQPRQEEAVDLNEAVKKVLADLEVPIEEKRAQIGLAPLPTVQGNRRQMEQLFHNLLSNALKYSKPDVPPCIAITTRKVSAGEAPAEPPLAEGVYHLVEVSDNGIGFEPQYAGRIFEMFQRLHGKAEYAGTGIGLAIARKVVENHQGLIWAEGELGVGAAFKVMLPADEAEPRNAG